MSKKLKAIFVSSFVSLMLTACGGNLPPMDEEEANAIKENIQIVTDDDNKVYGNIRLVTQYDDETTIKWRCNNKKVVSVTDQGKLKAGVVTRQEEDKTVKLTATINKAGKVATFEQEIVVAAAPEKIEDDYYEAYLFYW